MPPLVPSRGGSAAIRTARARSLGAVLGLAALACAVVLGPVSGAEQGFGGARFSGIRVDVRPLLAQGGGLQAQALRADLLASLQRSFADRLGGRGPTLVVLVRSLSLTPYAGSQGGGRSAGGGGGATQTDYLDGEALLVGRGGEVLARHPQLSATPASFGGAWYDPLSERRRIAAIADHYAQWLRRTLPAD